MSEKRAFLLWDERIVEKTKGTVLVPGTAKKHDGLLMDQDQLTEVKIALVDGVVRTRDDEEKLIEVRRKSRFLLAWGTCAALGGIPALANTYELEDLLEESYGQTVDPFSYYLAGDSPVINSQTFELDDVPATALPPLYAGFDGVCARHRFL